MFLFIYDIFLLGYLLALWTIQTGEGKIEVEIIHERRNRNYPTKWKYFTFSISHIFKIISNIWFFKNNMFIISKWEV